MKKILITLLGLLVTLGVLADDKKILELPATNSVGQADYIIVESLLGGVTNTYYIQVTNFVTAIRALHSLAQTTITNGLATINYVNTSTNGFIGPNITNGFATLQTVTSASNSLVTYAQALTNGFVSAAITNGLASTASLNSASNVLAGMVGGGVSPTNAIASWNGQGTNTAIYGTANILTNSTIPSNANFIFEGDSLTAGYGLSAGEAWPSVLMTLSSFVGKGTSTNVAVTASTITNILPMASRYVTNVYPLRPAATGKPAILMVWIGSNDILSNSGYPALPGATVFSALTNYVATAKADGFQVWCFTLIDRLITAFTWTPRDRYEAHEFNRLLREQRGNWDRLVDIAPLFPNCSNTTVFQADFTHLNANGNYRLAQFVNDLASAGTSQTKASPSFINANAGAFDSLRVNALQSVGQGPSTGANISGGDTTIYGGQSTGSGVPGRILFQQSPVGVAGSLTNALTTTMQLNTNGQVIIGQLDPSIPLASLSVRSDAGGNGVVVSGWASNYIAISSGGVAKSIIASGPLPFTIASSGDISFTQATLDRMRINFATGLIAIGGTNSASFPALKRSGTNLQVRLADDSGFADIEVSRSIHNAAMRLKGYTVGTLPAGTAGDMAYVTDAITPVWNTPATNGGSVVVPVFYNGTAWIVH